MKMLSKLKNYFIENVYNNPVIWPIFIGIIQFLIGSAAFIYCTCVIDDKLILLLMLLSWVSVLFASKNYEKASFNDGVIKTIIYIGLKIKDNLNVQEKAILESLEKDKKFQNIMKDGEILLKRMIKDTSIIHNNLKN